MCFLASEDRRENKGPVHVEGIKWILQESQLELSSERAVNRGQLTGVEKTIFRVLYVTDPVSLNNLTTLVSLQISMSTFYFFHI